MVWLPLGLAALCLGCAERTSLGRTPPPEVVLHGVTLRTYRGARLSVWGTAQKLVYVRASGNARADGAVLHFTGRGQAPAPRHFVVSAPVMLGNVVDHQAEAKGGVRLLGEGGLSGRTPSAQFDGARQIASGHAPVRVNAPRYRVHAGGFRFRLSEDALSFTQPVRTVVGAP